VLSVLQPARDPSTARDGDDGDKRTGCYALNATQTRCAERNLPHAVRGALEQPNVKAGEKITRRKYGTIVAASARAEEIFFAILVMQSVQKLSESFAAENQLT
jgi:hypothetical protein